MDDQRMDQLEQRLAQLERRPTMRERGTGTLDVLVPAETRRHLKNAGREQLLAVRSLLDYWIDQLVDVDERDKGREEITIE
jgi:hypothetical protein